MPEDFQKGARCVLQESPVHIPRVLHQIFFRRDEPNAPLPAAIMRIRSEFQEQNEGWTTELYNDRDMYGFIKSEYGLDVLKAYQAISPVYGAARADLFRYLLLYRVGGVYLDIKSRFVRPISEVIRGDEGFVSAHWSNAPGEKFEGWGLHEDLADVPRGEIQQWHIIAAPSHPFLAAVIEAVLRNVERYNAWRTGVGWGGVLHLTGPVAYTRAIMPLVGQYPGAIVQNEAALGLEYSAITRSEHRGLFGRHYSEVNEPIVRCRGAAGLANQAYCLVRSAKRRVSR